MQEHHLAAWVKEALACRWDSHSLEIGQVLPKYRTGICEDGGALPSLHRYFGTLLLVNHLPIATDFLG